MEVTVGHWWVIGSGSEPWVVNVEANDRSGRLVVWEGEENFESVHAMIARGIRFTHKVPSPDQLDDLARMKRTIDDIEACRISEGDSIEILCDDPEADSIEKTTAVESCSAWTNWKAKRIWGPNWKAAVAKAADQARKFYKENPQCLN